MLGRVQVVYHSIHVSTGSSRKLMQVVLSLNPGGTERLVVHLTRAARARFDVSVCCLDEIGLWGEDLRSQGIDVFTLGRQPGFHPGLSRGLARAAAARGVNLLHCHHYSPYVYGCLARLFRPGLRIIMTEHGRLSDEAPSWKRRLVTPALGVAGARTFAVSDDLRRYMMSAGFPASLGVIPNGIEVGSVPDTRDRAAARLALGLADHDLVIGTVGRLDPVKDLTTLIEAFVIVAARIPQARLIVAGSGPEHGRLETAAAGLLVDGRIRLLGHREDARALLPAFDLFVNTSISEGISLTLLEAMAARLPIAATAVGGTPEVVVDGETGRLFAPRDPAACADVLAQFLGSEAERTALGAAGRLRVESLFAIEIMTARYTDLYDRLSRGPLSE